PNCASAAAISCFFACSPLIVMAGLFIAQSILNQMID
ncbi:putative membrane protein, partial [Escherichia coli 2860650]